VAPLTNRMKRNVTPYTINSKVALYDEVGPFYSPKDCVVCVMGDRGSGMSYKNIMLANRLGLKPADIVFSSEDLKRKWNEWAKEISKAGTTKDGSSKSKRRTKKTRSTSGR
jgi:hypothetical protein